MSWKLTITDSELEDSIKENLNELSISLGMSKQNVMKEALEFFYEQYYRKIIKGR